VLLEAGNNQKHGQREEIPTFEGVGHINETNY